MLLALPDVAHQTSFERRLGLLGRLEFTSPDAVSSLTTGSRPTSSPPTRERPRLRRLGDEGRVVDLTRKPAASPNAADGDADRWVVCGARSLCGWTTDLTCEVNTGNLFGR